MAELLRTNDVGLLTIVGSLLTEAEIPHHVADREAALMDGSINAFQQRVLVHDDREAEARQLLHDAGLGDQLPT
jgi:hypothetical protein